MCIQYLIAFSGDVTQDDSVLDPMSVVFDSGSKVNAMHMAFVIKFGFVVQTINIGTQKIDGTTFEIYKMIIAAFSVTNQADKVKFFKKTFLVANVSSEVVLGMPFLTLSNADIDFPKREL